MKWLATPPCKPTLRTQVKHPPPTSSKEREFRMGLPIKGSLGCLCVIKPLRQLPATRLISNGSSGATDEPFEMTVHEF